MSYSRVTVLALNLLATALVGCRTPSGAEGSKAQADEADEPIISCLGSTSNGQPYRLKLTRAGFDRQPGNAVQAIVNVGSEPAKTLNGRATVSESTIDANFGLQHLHVQSHDEGVTYQGSLSQGATSIRLACKTKGDAEETRTPGGDDAHLLSCSGKGSNGKSFTLIMDRAGFDQQAGIPVKATLVSQDEAEQNLIGRASVSESSIDANFGLERLHVQSKDEGMNYRGNLTIGELIVTIKCRANESH